MCITTRQREAPLKATLAAIAPVLAPQVARIGRAEPGAGWLRRADLLTGAGLDAMVRELRQAYGYDREVAVSSFLAAYTAGVAGPAIATYVVRHRVPDLAADGLALHGAPGGWFDVTAFHTERMTVLPDDPMLADGARLADGGVRPDDPVRPDAGTVRATIDVVEDHAALRLRLVTNLVEHLEPLVLALRPRARLGLPALWGAVATQCGRAFLLTERVTGDPDIGRMEADAFFALACPPMRARPTWSDFTHRGRRQTAMRRGSCCLVHRMSGQYCTTCPFTSDSERERRLREWIDTQGDEGLAVG
nr:(2Fe-2S)-binding protein [Frankia sp. Cas3]